MALLQPREGNQGSASGSGKLTQRVSMNMNMYYVYVDEGWGLLCYRKKNTTSIKGPEKGTISQEKLNAFEGL